MHSGGGTYRHGRMYPPPRGGEFGRGDEYGYYVADAVYTGPRRRYGNGLRRI
jgi:hypothetical protein